MQVLMIELDNDRKGQSGLGTFKEKFPCFLLIPDLDNLVVEENNSLRSPHKFSFRNLTQEAASEVQVNNSFLKEVEVPDDHVRMLHKIKSTQEELSRLEEETVSVLNNDDQVMQFLGLGSVIF